MTSALVGDLMHQGLNAISISIDDFYLTRTEQVAFAKCYSQNRLLQQRGYPGTHDIALGLKTLESFRASERTKIPVYEKSLHNGRGDRLPETEWRVATSPVDVIFLEGWMLGFTPVNDDILPDANFRQINQFLNSYLAWYSFFDHWIFLVPSQVEDIIEWRIEAEEKMKDQGKPGLSREEATAYIELFIPAYKIYLPNLIKNPPQRDLEKSIRLTLQKNRLPV